MEHLLADVSYSYNTSASGGGALGFLLIFDLVLYVVTGVGLYKTFQKAGSNGQPPWAGFVPIYNFYVLLKVAGRPTWWLWFALSPLVLIIPVLGVILYIVAVIAILVGWIFVLNDTSKSFGHSGAFTVGLFFLPVIFFCILGFDRNSYRGPAGPVGRASGGYQPPAGSQPPGGYPPQYPAAGSAPAGGWAPPVGQAPPPPPPAMG